MNGADNKASFEIQALKNGEWIGICPALSPRHAVEMADVVAHSEKSYSGVRIWSNRLNKVMNLA